MNYSRMNDKFSISGALSLTELVELKQQGVDIIINSRINGEDPQQIDSEDYLHAVEALGMQYVFIPVRSLEYPSEAIKRFGAAISNPALKVHAFCRTGKRVSHLWALSQANTRSLTDVLMDCANANIDISAVFKQLDEIAIKKADSSSA
jgi:uncharacterized protein (TIGR01244 family)